MCGKDNDYKGYLRVRLQEYFRIFMEILAKNHTGARGDPRIGSVARGMVLLVGTFLSGSEVPRGRTTRVALENCSRRAILDAAQREFLTVP